MGQREDEADDRDGWFIREEDGRWIWTDKRIAAVAALTEGYEVVPVGTKALASPATSREEVAETFRKHGLEGFDDLEAAILALLPRPEDEGAAA